MKLLPLLNFLFPPLCLGCGAKCSTKIFCISCWLLCELPDPVNRCRHCFQELEVETHLCLRCQKKPLISAEQGFVFDPESPARLLNLSDADALAGFAVLQWIQLEWPFPDAIVPMPDSIPIASSFANLLDRPIIRALTHSHEYREGRLEEDQIILLFNVSNSLHILQKSVRSLSRSFPKKINLLSLY